MKAATGGNGRQWAVGIVALAVGTAWSPARLPAQVPTEPPPAAALRPLQFPPFQEATLANGLQVVVVENHELPIVSISLALPAGNRYEPAGRAGLADLVAELLTKGTKTRTAEQIAATIEGVGSSLGASADPDFLFVRSTVLTDHVGLAFDLIGDVMLNATFPESELELARTRMLSQLRLERSAPEAVADRYFAARLYGDHPYGRRATEASVRAVTATVVRGYAATRLRPRGALLV
ncbi:MAG: M16 family metallopeptidase, partial [Gemmatimonadales bacterium]